MLLAVLPASFLLAACSDSERTPVEAVTENRALWESTRPEVYAFTYQRSCFCGLPAGLGLRITVHGDSVTKVEVVSGGAGGASAPEAQLEWGRTIDQVFDHLAAIAAADPARFDATWDRDLGFPRTVFVDRHPNVIDDEEWIELRDFTQLVPLD